jgi:hypothetical protein
VKIICYFKNDAVYLRLITTIWRVGIYFLLTSNIIDVNSEKENKRINCFQLLKVKQTKCFLKNCFGKCFVLFINPVSFSSFPFSLLCNRFVFYKKSEHHTSFKQANHIWFLGKNNFEDLGFCRDLFSLVSKSRNRIYEYKLN